VILAVEGGNNRLPPGVDSSIFRIQKYIFVTQESCNQFTLGNFVGSILTKIENNPVEGIQMMNRSSFGTIWSYTRRPTVPSSSKIDLFPNLFHSVDCPPYWPKMAPIEYLYCDLASELDRRCTRDRDVDNLRRNIYEICSSISSEGRM